MTTTLQALTQKLPNENCARLLVFQMGFSKRADLDTSISVGNYNPNVVTSLCLKYQTLVLQKSLMMISYSKKHEQTKKWLETEIAYTNTST